MNIAAPVFFVEIDGEEAAGIILKKRIDAENMTPAQMGFYGVFVIGAVFRMGTIHTFSFRLQADTGLPFVFACRTVAGASVFALPAAGIYIRSPLE